MDSRGAPRQVRLTLTCPSYVDMSVCVGRTLLHAVARRIRANKDPPSEECSLTVPRLCGAGNALLVAVGHRRLAPWNASDRTRRSAQGAARSSIGRGVLALDGVDDNVEPTRVKVILISADVCASVSKIAMFSLL
jgi:hypothetical protein